MSDKEAEYYEQRAGLNEPAPEEPTGRYDSDPQIAQGLTERDIIQRQIDGNNANLLMVMRAMWRNYRSR